MTKRRLDESKATERRAFSQLKKMEENVAEADKEAEKHSNAIQLQTKKTVEVQLKYDKLDISYREAK